MLKRIEGYELDLVRGAIIDEAKLIDCILANENLN